jgi:hypothetical protein
VQRNGPRFARSLGLRRHPSGAAPHVPFRLRSSCFAARPRCGTPLNRSRSTSIFRSVAATLKPQELRAFEQCFAETARTERTERTVSMVRAACRVQWL